MAERRSGVVIRASGSPVAAARNLLGALARFATTVEDYNYDDRYQVTSVARSINGTPAANVALAYDLNGNRSAKNGVAYNYNAADQLMSGGPEAVSMAYNGTGSASSLRIGSDLQQYTYDFRDMPTAIATANGTAHNVYNGLNQRLSHTATDGTVSNYLWSGDQLLTEFNGNQVKADYLLGVFREGIRTADGWRFYLRDGIGSIIALTDESGNVTDSYDYDEFGNLLASSSTTSYNPFMFSGEQFDADVGQYYLRNRFYQPTLGRFLVRDPIGYSGGMNLYAYVGNNPVNAIDPQGLRPPRVFLGVGPDAPALGLTGVQKDYKDAGFQVVYQNPATLRTVTGAIGSDYSLVFTTSHAYVGAGPKFEGGNLRLRDLKASDIEADIVILSGCNQALDCERRIAPLLRNDQAVGAWDTTLPKGDENIFRTRFLTNLLQPNATLASARRTTIDSLRSQGQGKLADQVQQHFHIYGNQDLSLRRVRQ